MCIMTQPGIEFYRLRCSNQSGDSLNDVWNYEHSQYEAGHNFIQWVFPSDEPSSVNPYAPVVDDKFRKIFKSEPVLRLRLKRSFLQFLDFIGLSLDHNNHIEIKNHGLFYLRVLRPNHNLQRITRVLRCLFILGHKTYAFAFHRFLMNHQNQINPITVDYWNGAITS